MSSEFKQNLVSQTVWPLNEPTSVNEPKKIKLTFSLLVLVIAWIIAGLFFYFNHFVMTSFVVCISSFVFICAQFFPKAYKVIESLFQKLSYYVGLTITRLTLVPFFYLCFGLGRLVQKMKGKDPMKRELDSNATSYWQKRDIEIDREQYRRQF